MGLHSYVGLCVSVCLLCVHVCVYVCVCVLLLLLLVGSLLYSSTVETRLPLAALNISIAPVADLPAVGVSSFSVSMSGLCSVTSSVQNFCLFVDYNGTGIHPDNPLSVVTDETSHADFSRSSSDSRRVKVHSLLGVALRCVALRCVALRCVWCFVRIFFGFQSCFSFFELLFSSFFTPLAPSWWPAFNA